MSAGRVTNRKRPKRYWTYTGRFAFYSKKDAMRFLDAVESVFENDTITSACAAGSGYIVHQPLRSVIHTIQFDADPVWTIQHPIWCDVRTCRLPKLAAKLKAPPVPPGRYFLFLTKGKFDIGNPVATDSTL